MLRLHANTSSPGVYWRKRLNQQAHLALCHRNPDILERVLNWTTLSNSMAEKCAPMQVIKQPEHGRISTTEERKWSSFQTNLPYLELSKTVMDLMVWKYRFAKEWHSPNIDIQKQQKNRWSSIIWWKKVMSEKNQGLQHK